MSLHDVDDDDDDNQCSVVVALMQKNRRFLKKYGVGNLTIGYEIYKVPNLCTTKQLFVVHQFGNGVMCYGVVCLLARIFFGKRILTKLFCLFEKKKQKNKNNCSPLAV